MIICSPHYDLVAIQRSFRSLEDLIISSQTFRQLSLLGLSLEGLLGLIHALTPTQFEKTSHSAFDYQLWQDSYNIHWEGRQILINFQATMVGEFMVTLELPQSLS